ncbi:MAG: hypothetical protein ACXVDD_18685, partial [Polyangia bacterium]
GIANQVGAALGSDGPFRVRLYPAQVEGDVPWASVELVPAGGLAVVFADNDMLAVVDGRLVGFQRAAQLVDAVVAYVRGGVRPNAIELVCDALPYVAARVAVAGSWWRASHWGYWDRSSTSGTSINLGGDEWGNLAQLTQTADGVELRTALRWDEPVMARERGELPALYERIAGDLGAAIAARARFRARPFSIRTVGARLLAALAKKRWQLRVRENFPGASDAVIWHRDPLGEHFEAILGERDGVVTVDGRALHDAAELEAALPELVAAIRRGAEQLRPDQLSPGATYRVLQPFNGLAVGQRVTFFKVEHYPRDGGSRWLFGPLELYDQSDADCKILGALHEYLALDLLW